MNMAVYGGGSLAVAAHRARFLVSGHRRTSRVIGKVGCQEVQIRCQGICGMLAVNATRLFSMIYQQDEYNLYKYGEEVQINYD